VDYVEEMLDEGGEELVRDMDVLAVQTHAGWAMEVNRWAKRPAGRGGGASGPCPLKTPSREWGYGR